MRIGIATTFLDHRRAGTWVYTFNLIKHLLAIDRENEYFRLDLKETSSFDSLPCRKLVFKFPQFKLGKFLFPNLVLPMKLKGAVDLVHFPNPYGSFMPARKYKTVVTIHDISPLLFPRTQTRMNVFHHKYLLPAIIKQTDLILTVSESSRRDIINYYSVPERKVVAVHNGVDARFKPNKNTEALSFKRELPSRYILFVGTLDKRKNFETLIGAFKLIKDRKLSHKLVISGAKGWMDVQVDALIARLGLQKEILFVHASDDELPILYSLADLFVLPSFYEGFGLPVVEAMACGTPVVAANTAALPEIIGEAGLLANPYSPEDFSQAMLKVLTDDGLRNQLVQKGLVRAQNFTWEKCARETLNAYLSILGR
jgi:glycosyltransferase involved in cell wall biosynthesis